MKHVFRPSRLGVAAAALAAFCAAAVLVGAQVSVPSAPDPFIVQITATTIPAVPPATPTPTPSPTPTPTPGATPTPGTVDRNSFAAGTSGDGRFVVIESAGDISTERTPDTFDASGNLVARGRHNEDGNQEIFLFDYAQRRVFQITDTRNALKNQALSPIASVNIDVQVVNLRPQISNDGRYIVFISNAYTDADDSLSPKRFDGNQHAAALKLDGNTEIFLYEIPQPPAADLTSGTEIALTDLSTGPMRRITRTPATRLPHAGTVNLSPFFARDNDAPAVSDDIGGEASDGAVVAFHSQARAGNIGFTEPEANRGNPEIFVFKDDSLDAANAGAVFTQVTATADVAPSGSDPLGRLVFNNNPSLSGAGARLAFISNADIPNTGTAEATADQGNGEIYVADINTGTAAVSNLRRATTTPPERRVGFEGVSVNLLSPGKRMSHDGNLLAFESTAVFSTAGAVSELASSVGIYIYNIPASSFTLVVARPPTTQAQDIGLRFPTFTGDNTRVVWSSILNLKADGTVAEASDTTGLNPGIVSGEVTLRPTQIFSAPVSALNQVSRLTRLRGHFDPIQPFPSNTIRRMAFTSNRELGGGNPTSLDAAEAFYLFIPAGSDTAAPSPTPVAFSTGASDRPVVAASPVPSPSPAVTGLAPGMLGIGRSTLTLAPSAREVDTNTAHERNRRPPLPTELNGVSVSINDAAAGLYSVAPNQFNFVVPPGLAASATALPVVINNNGAVIRTSLVLNGAQPDIFTSTNGPGGRAAVLNVTNPCVTPPGEPFNETSARPTGGNCLATTTETVQTELLIMLTGVRNATRTSVSVTIGTTNLTCSNVTAADCAILSVGPSLTPGFDQIVVRLPTSFNESGDLPVVVTATVGGATFTSRPADTAPRIQITATP